MQNWRAYVLGVLHYLWRGFLVVAEVDGDDIWGITFRWRQVTHSTGLVNDLVPDAYTGFATAAFRDGVPVHVAA